MRKTEDAKVRQVLRMLKHTDFNLKEIAQMLGLCHWVVKDINRRHQVRHYLSRGRYTLSVGAA